MLRSERCSEGCLDCVRGLEKERRSRNELVKKVSPSDGKVRLYEAGPPLKVIVTAD